MFSPCARYFRHPRRRNTVVLDPALKTYWAGSYQNNLTNAIFCDLCWREEKKEGKGII